VLADHFFQGAFGGSFLNHQYLICACAPEYPNADSSPAKPSIAILDMDAAGHFLPRLKPAAGAPASALEGPPKFAKSGNIAPENYFGDGKFRAVNTMQPPYQPSGNPPASTDGAGLYADPSKHTTLPPQTDPTIGDRLNEKRVSWHGMPAPGRRRSPTGAHRRQRNAVSSMRPKLRPAAPTSSRITSLSIITRSSIRRRTAPSVPRISRITISWSPTSRPADCPP